MCKSFISILGSSNINEDGNQYDLLIKETLELGTLRVEIIEGIQFNCYKFQKQILIGCDNVGKFFQLKLPGRAGQFESKKAKKNYNHQQVND